MKSFLRSPLLALVSFLFLHLAPAFGATPAATAAGHKIPFHGTIVALDSGAQTITLNGKSARVVHVESDTKIIDGNGNPTTFSTAALGEAVSGAYIKNADGTLALTSLRLGAKPGSKAAAKTAAATTAATATGAAAAPPPVPAPATAPTTPAATAASDAATTSKPSAVKKTRFSGKVTAVDATAGTFSIKSRTFTTSPATVITDSTGAAATLADVAVGAKVSGTYEKSPDGTTMTADTLKVSK